VSDPVDRVPPPRIWIGPLEHDDSEWVWNDTSLWDDGEGYEYVRADKVGALLAETERLREAATKWLELKMAQSCWPEADRDLWRKSLARALRASEKGKSTRSDDDPR